MNRNLSFTELNWILPRTSLNWTELNFTQNIDAIGHGESSDPSDLLLLDDDVGGVGVIDGGQQRGLRGRQQRHVDGVADILGQVPVGHDVAVVLVHRLRVLEGCLQQVVREDVPVRDTNTGHEV